MGDVDMPEVGSLGGSERESADMGPTAASEKSLKEPCSAPEYSIFDGRRGPPVVLLYVATRSRCFGKDAAMGG